MTPHELIRRIERDLTELKTALQDVAASPLARFIGGHLHRVEGRSIAFSVFYDLFRDWLPEHDRIKWTKARVIQELLPLKVVDTGRSDQPTKVVEGLSLSPAAGGEKPVASSAAYDSDAMFQRIREMHREQKLSFQQIAGTLNEEGLLNEKGRPWDWIDVRQVDAD